MIRFSKVFNNLYRGGEPSIHDLSDLKNKYNIQRIVSLDDQVVQKIHRVVQSLDMDHQIFPIYGTQFHSLLNILSKDLNSLLNSVPTFLHCKYGKDRTGLIVALFRCQVNGWCCLQALAEANDFNFCQGLSEKTTNFYHKIIQKSCKNHLSNDINDSEDIVNNVRSKKDDFISSYLDEANRKSTAPFSDQLKFYDGTEYFNNSEYFMSRPFPFVGLDPNPNIGVGPVDKGNGFVNLGFPMDKRANNIQLSQEVSELEKKQAAKALAAFKISKETLDKALNHLKIIYTPFKDHPDISTEQIVKFRAALRRYRDKSIENFNKLKIVSFKCISLIQPFSSDTQTSKLIKSFISSIESLEKNVNHFSELFNDLEAKSFAADIVKIIDVIIKESEELQDIIEERILNHLQTNIIGKTWVDNVSSDLNVIIEKKVPRMLQLFQERSQQLNKKE